MTWTLRFYDEDGTEIGYVQKPDRTTYNVTITHPDSGWEDFERQVRGLQNVSEPDEGPENLDDYLEGAGWRVDHGPRRLKFPPQQHLQLVQEQIFDPDLGSMELADE